MESDDIHYPICHVSCTHSPHSWNSQSQVQSVCVRGRVHAESSRRWGPSQLQEECIQGREIETPYSI